MEHGPLHNQRVCSQPSGIAEWVIEYKPPCILYTSLIMNGTGQGGEATIATTITGSLHVHVHTKPIKSITGDVI